MSKKDGILDVPIRKIWFEKIKSGEKTHEYRRCCSHWCCKTGISIDKNLVDYTGCTVNKIRFRCGQITKAADKEKTMLFEIKSISCIDGKETDLKYDGLVFDIELGKEIECLKLTQ